jgi:hypothetical protein
MSATTKRARTSSSSSEWENEQERIAKFGTRCAQDWNTATKFPSPPTPVWLRGEEPHQTSVFWKTEWGKEQDRMEAFAQACTRDWNTWRSHPGPIPVWQKRTEPQTDAIAETTTKRARTSSSTDECEEEQGPVTVRETLIGQMMQGDQDRRRALLVGFEYQIIQGIEAYGALMYAAENFERDPATTADNLITKLHALREADDGTRAMREGLHKMMQGEGSMVLLQTFAAQVKEEVRVGH